MAAYNEEKNIKNTISSLKNEGYKNIIVVDDGSKDNTYKIAKSQKITVLKHDINLGQGAALQTGMTYALLNGAQYLVHFDSDGQHDPKEIKDILNPIINKEVDVTLGSRFLKNNKEKIPTIRKMKLKIGILVIWFFYGVLLSDSHNGFRGMSRSAAKKIVITTDRMEHASEIIDRIRKNRIKYKEIPVTIKYTKDSIKNGRKGQSKFDELEIVIKMLLKKIGM